MSIPIILYDYVLCINYNVFDQLYIIYYNYYIIIGIIRINVTYN